MSNASIVGFIDLTERERIERAKRIKVSTDNSEDPWGDVDRAKEARDKAKEVKEIIDYLDHMAEYCYSEGSEPEPPEALVRMIQRENKELNRRAIANPNSYEGQIFQQRYGRIRNANEVYHEVN